MHIAEIVMNELPILYCYDNHDPIKASIQQMPERYITKYTSVDAVELV